MVLQWHERIIHANMPCSFLVGCMCGFSSHVHGVVQAIVAERTIDIYVFYIHLRQVKCFDLYHNEAIFGHKRSPARKCPFPYIIYLIKYNINVPLVCLAHAYESTKVAA